VDDSSFQCVIFSCKWWDTFDRKHVKEDHDSGLICNHSKKMGVETKEHYVLQNTATKCFFTHMFWMGIGGSYWDMI
jgi:hypothetical protein